MRIILLVVLLLVKSNLYCQSDNDWSEYIEIINEKNVNTELSEFAPSYLNEFITFVKANPRQNIFDKKTKEPYYDLHVSSRYNGGFLTRSENLSSRLNSPYHEGPATFSKAGDQIYFTRVDYDKGAFTLNSDKTVTLKIFQSKYNNGDWLPPTKVPTLNEDNLPSCHPALSRDGHTMIFASDRPGGYGKMDLYKSEWQDGKWSTPYNLGPNINSSGNEWFPNLNDRDYLFYASDSYTPEADLDIYMTRHEGSDWLNPIALPTPINSSYDDFALITDSDAINGYFTTNRPGGVGKDDLYSFNSLQSLYGFMDANYNDIYLTIIDESALNLIGSIIKYRPVTKEEINSFDKNIFTFPQSISDSIKTTEPSTTLSLNEGYTLVEVTYPGKESWQIVMFNHGVSKHIDIKLIDKKIEIKEEPKIVYIEKEIAPKEAIKNVVIDVGAVIIFDNIYYDYNSYSLTKGAKLELDGLAKNMLTNANLKIQLSAHTDSRGNAEYNLELSEKRALSAKNYLVSKGINPNSIQAVGYGETKLRNHCKDKVYCSEAEHIYNRRTEVKILEK